MKPSELTGAALDWAVAKCEDIGLGPRGSVVYYFEGDPAMWQPSTDWAQGGPIIEREGIRIVKVAQGVWGAVYSSGNVGREHFAKTPLIAAMRCYVASKLGDEVDVPEELCPPTA
jgi:hypothetical protein